MSQYPFEGSSLPSAAGAELSDVVLKVARRDLPKKEALRQITILASVSEELQISDAEIAQAVADGKTGLTVSNTFWTVIAYGLAWFGTAIMTALLFAGLYQATQTIVSTGSWVWSKIVDAFKYMLNSPPGQVAKWILSDGDKHMYMSDPNDEKQVAAVMNGFRHGLTALAPPWIISMGVLPANSQAPLPAGLNYAPSPQQMSTPKSTYIPQTQLVSGASPNPDTGIFAKIKGMFGYDAEGEEDMRIAASILSKETGADPNVMLAAVQKLSSISEDSQRRLDQDPEGDSPSMDDEQPETLEDGGAIRIPQF